MYSYFRRHILILGLIVLIAITSVPSLPVPAHAAPATDHPRLWLRSSDLPRLRSWAVDSNPVYRDGLAALAAEAVQAMDSGSVPAQDSGSTSYDEFPNEMYAQLFAFMSLIDNDPVKRADYGKRARTLLMYVIDKAAQGVAEGQPFREPSFATSDRSRWFGSGFGLTVDWIYPTLSAQDKATIRNVFIRWIDENIHATTTDHNHPEPVGLLNDPRLIADPVNVRWSANNYFNAHMRNIGLMAMAFDLADDPDGKMRGYIANATGAWLYMTDHLLRTDARGGFAPEGFEYGPQSMGYVAQFLLALYTAGLDDPRTYGPQVVFKDNPFWDESIIAYLQSLSPATVNLPDVGDVYQPAWYGDAQNYWGPDFIPLFGPMGIYDQAVGNSKRLETLRWIELNDAPGGPSALTARAHDQDFYSDAILYFLLFDPTAPAPADPHSALPTTYYGAGLQRLLARTDWTPGATWFTYSLPWDTIDHQTADGNTIQFYRQGEWLTMQRIGYDLDYATSDNLNTLTIQNDKPDRDPDDYRIMVWTRGSQWFYEPAGDPPPPLISINDQFVFAQGDATNLYNSTYESITDVLHASRSVIWLKPDIIVVYDRAATKTANRPKRFWLNFPAKAVTSGKVTTMTTEKGQQLFVTTLLPADAAINVSALPDEKSGPPANAMPMKYRLTIEAPGGPKEARFLNVMQGADAGAKPQPVQLLASTEGTPFAGAVVGKTVVLFPVNLDATFTSVSYAIPASVTTQIVTGLQPDAAYTINEMKGGDTVQVKITPGSTLKADSGGVLVIPAP